MIVGESINFPSGMLAPWTQQSRPRPSQPGYGRKSSLSLANRWEASMIWRMLLRSEVSRAWSLARVNAGKRSPARMATRFRVGRDSPSASTICLSQRKFNQETAAQAGACIEEFRRQPEPLEDARALKLLPYEIARIDAY